MTISDKHAVVVKNSTRSCSQSSSKLSKNIIDSDSKDSTQSLKKHSACTSESEIVKTDSNVAVVDNELSLSLYDSESINITNSPTLCVFNVKENPTGRNQPNLSHVPKKLTPPMLQWSPVCSTNLTEMLDIHNKVIESGVYIGCKIRENNHLNFDLWESLIDKYHGKVVLEFLKYGFSIGYSSKELPKSCSRNHKGAHDYPNDVDLHINKEMSHGATLGPFKTPPFNVNFFTSSLNTVSKKR